MFFFKSRRQIFAATFRREVCGQRDERTFPLRLHSVYFCKQCPGTDTEVQTDKLCFHICNATSKVTGVSTQVLYNTKACFTPIRLTPVYFKPIYQIISLLNLRSLKVRSRPFGWLRSIRLTPYFWWKYNSFIYAFLIDGHFFRNTKRA